MGQDKKYIQFCAAAAAKPLQSCPTLCDPIDGSPPGSPIPGTLQARTLEWVAISFSKSKCNSRILIIIHHQGKLCKKSIIERGSRGDLLAGWFAQCLFTIDAAAAESLQSCPTLCDPIDGSPPGSAIPGILQARTLEWVAIPSPMHEREK